MAKHSTASAHTPGPWKITHQWNGTAILESVTTGEVVAEIQKHGTKGLYSVGANASLIAAAPDLLAACKQALEDGDDYAAMESLKAAIAKAEGKS